MTAREIEDILDRLKEVYPFAGYVDGTATQIRERLRVLTRFVSPPARVLDIGCGGMDCTAAFQMAGFQCCGVDDFMDDWHRVGDNREKLLAFAKTMGINVHVQKAGDVTIPSAPGSFDVVTLMDIIEHLHGSPIDLLNTAGAMLKENGVLLITMPNSVHLNNRISVLCGNSNYPDVRYFYHSPEPWRSHVREYTLAETQKIVSASGFDSMYSEYYHPWAKSKLKRRLFRYLFLLMCKVVPSFSEAFMVLAKKPRGWRPAVRDRAVYAALRRQTMPKGVSPCM